MARMGEVSRPKINPQMCVNSRCLKTYESVIILVHKSLDRVSISIRDTPVDSRRAMEFMLW